VALYHLEGRSYAVAERQARSRYNAWLQTWLWGEAIEESMQREGVWEGR
jgi:hypothetical protein